MRGSELAPTSCYYFRAGSIVNSGSAAIGQIKDFVALALATHLEAGFGAPQRTLGVAPILPQALKPGRAPENTLHLLGILGPVGRQLQPASHGQLGGHHQGKLALNQTALVVAHL